MNNDTPAQMPDELRDKVQAKIEMLFPYSGDNRELWRDIFKQGAEYMYSHLPVMRWVKASEQNPKPYKQLYIKNGANWDLGHYDPEKDNFCCLGGWAKNKERIQWLEEAPPSSPPEKERGTTIVSTPVIGVTGPVLKSAEPPTNPDK